MYELITTYGMLALGLILAALGAGLTKYVFALSGSKTINDLLARLWAEMRAAVLEVGQTYADALKLGNADGKLTSEEKAIAKRRAIDIAKKNFGKAGLLRLARVLGIDDSWIGNKVEALVRETKLTKLPVAVALPPKPQA